MCERLHGRGRSGAVSSCVAQFHSLDKLSNTEGQRKVLGKKGRRLGGRVIEA